MKPSDLVVGRNYVVRKGGKTRVVRFDGVRKIEVYVGHMGRSKTRTVPRFDTFDLATKRAVTLKVSTSFVREANAGDLEPKARAAKTDFTGLSAVCPFCVAAGRGNGSMILAGDLNTHDGKPVHWMKCVVCFARGPHLGSEEAARFEWGRVVRDGFQARSRF
jgi:hypothetical protein